MSNRWWWLIWGGLTVAGVGYLTAAAMSENAATSPLLSPARAFLLPGATTHGHYQIELKCESCHTSPFGGVEVLQEACMNCHGAELKDSNDKHPKSKFTDPRNAELLERIDATLCVTCHSEHRPAITTTMGLSVPPDVCAHCHQSIAEDRPSHQGMGFETCATSGCHNYHDNRALYEDFLLKHAEDAAHAANPHVRSRDLAESIALLPEYPSSKYPVKTLQVADADAPKQFVVAPHTDDWLASKHSQAGVNCSACHTRDDRWLAKPDTQTCASCHALEAKGFDTGKHGMRAAAGLPAMSPKHARLPMRDDAQDEQLTCVSCHGAHRFDTRFAATEACLTCHRDEHTLAFEQSPHAKLWKAEVAGTAPENGGVSCATCHLPRLQHTDRTYDITRTLVQHNQNDTLRPNEKMLRPVCQSCHGLAFSIDALADRELIRRNFTGAPAAHIKSIDMAVQRDIESQAARAAAE